LMTGDLTCQIPRDVGDLECIGKKTKIRLVMGRRIAEFSPSESVRGVSSGICDGVLLGLFAPECMWCNRRTAEIRCCWSTRACISPAATRTMRNNPRRRLPADRAAEFSRAAQSRCRSVTCSALSAMTCTQEPPKCHHIPCGSCTSPSDVDLAFSF
jgi:hypothetical protein